MARPHWRYIGEHSVCSVMQWENELRGALKILTWRAWNLYRLRLVRNLVCSETNDDSRVPTHWKIAKYIRLLDSAVPCQRWTWEFNINSFISVHGIPSRNREPRQRCWMNGKINGLLSLTSHYCSSHLVSMPLFIAMTTSRFIILSVLRWN